MTVSPVSVIVDFDQHRPSDGTVHIGPDPSKNQFSTPSVPCSEPAFSGSENKPRSLQILVNSTPAVKGTPYNPVGIVKSPISVTFTAPLRENYGGAVFGCNLRVSATASEVGL